jgi:hypothetical protein
MEGEPDLLSDLHAHAIELLFPFSEDVLGLLRSIDEEGFELGEVGFELWLRSGRG